MNCTVLSLFAVRPHRIGGTEVYARELAEQLARRGWSSVVGFTEAPPPAVRDFLSLPNVAIEVFDAGRNLTRDLTRLIRAHRPQILHLHYLGFVSPCPWVARLLGVRQIYFTDQASPPEGFTPAAAPWWKRIAVRTVNAPVNAVISVSEHGRSVLAARQVMPERRLRLIYNSVDVERAACGARRCQEFRERYGIPETALVFAQVGQLIREKGLHDLLQAAVTVMAAEPRAWFWPAEARNGRNSRRPRRGSGSRSA